MNTPEDFARANAEVLALAKAMGRGERTAIQPAEKKRWWQYGSDRPAYSTGWGGYEPLRASDVVDCGGRL